MKSVVAALVAAAALAGCGSSESSSTGSGGAATSTDAGAQAAAQKRLDEWYTGTDRALPSDGPKPQPGKNIWVIACASAAEGCAIPARAIKEAGSKIAWKVTVFDGAFDPTVQSNGIRQAVSDKADAIVLVAIDCPNVSTAVENAQAAGIKIYGDFSLDCNEAGNAGEPLFDGTTTMTPERIQYGEYLRDVRARVGADWAIAKGGNDANVLIVDQSDLLNSKVETEGFKEHFANDCPSCKVATVEFTGADLLSGGVKSIVSAALARDPSVDVVVAPYDASITLGIGPAVEQAARVSGNAIQIVGYEGLSANIAEIKKGGPTTFSSGFPSRWAGWQTVDELNRLFNGQPLVDQGMGFQAVDKNHNLPAKSTYYDGNVDADGNPKQDYEANFLKLWGVG